MRGTYFWNRRNEDGIKKAVSYFEQAIAADENYALAHAGLALALCPMGYLGYSAPGEVLPKMRAAATRAVSLDPTLPEAHVAMAAVLTFYEWNWSEGEREFQRAVELNPSLPIAHHWYALLRECLSRYDEALEQRRRARELDPTSPPILAALGQTLFRLGHNEQALTELHKAVEMDNSLDGAHVGIGNVYQQRGDYARATPEYRLAAQYSPASGRDKAFLGYALAQAGNTREANQILSELMSASHERYVSAVHLAIICAGLGDKETAMNWLEKAYDRGDPALCDVMTQLRFRSPYAHPRFKRLLQKMGLAATQSRFQPIDGQSYFVRSALRSSSLTLAIFAAMRRVSLRLPERLRRFDLVV